MENLKFYKMPSTISKRLAFLSLSMMFATTTLAGCGHELAPEEDYDVVNKETMKMGLVLV